MERISTAAHELRRAYEFDYVVFNENDRLEKTLDTIDAVITVEGCKIPRVDNEF